MDRMLVEKIENRILVGIVMFVGIMLMLGWVAINENARMATFLARNEARSIENGALLFAANCSSCHGTDGRGIALRAPALNSPAFFGHDFFADIKARRSELIKEQNTLTQEQTKLTAELEGTVTAERRAEIETRLAEIEERLGDTGIAGELAALQAEQDALLQQMTPALDKGYDPLGGLEGGNYDRIKQANWNGSLEAYVYTTLVHGRAQNAGLWGGNLMVAWSQQAGGPLRDDQLRDLTRYILNWDKGDNWTLEDLLAVNQFALVPGAGGGAEITGDPAGTDVAAILAAWEADGIVGDPIRGDALYHGRERTQIAQRLACAGCHEGGAQGPATEGTWERVLNERLVLPQFAGYTAQQYVLESIVVPGAYTVEGYAAGLMPANYGQITSAQDLADIVAYLNSTDPNYVPPAPAEEATTMEAASAAP